MWRNSYIVKTLTPTKFFCSHVEHAESIRTTWIWILMIRYFYRWAGFFPFYGNCYFRFIRGKKETVDWRNPESTDFHYFQSHQNHRVYVGIWLHYKRSCEKGVIVIKIRFKNKCETFFLLRDAIGKSSECFQLILAHATRVASKIGILPMRIFVCVLLLLVFGELDIKIDFLFF